MEDQMARLPGLLSNLSDQVTKFFLAIGEAGGINAFGAAISAASAAMVFATENLDILGTAFMAAAAAAGIAFGPTMILAAIAAVQTAVVTLYTVIAANPFAALAMALGAAAVIMVRHFDDIKRAASRAAINIQIGWNKLLLFLMGVFAPALTSITDLFKGVQRQAIATWTAVKAATMAPLDALDVFNDTFNDTLEALEDGDRSAGVFGDQMRTTETRIVALEGELETLNTEVETADDNFVETERSLSDFKVQIDETEVAAAAAAATMIDLQEATKDVLDTIDDEREALQMNSMELEIRNNLQKAGVEATSELGQQIIAATVQLSQEKAAMDAASTAADELAKANEAAQKKIEEDTKATKNAISGFFEDLFTNGKSAFDNLADSFKSMLIKMAAELAASQVMKFLSGGALGGAGAAISGAVSAATGGLIGGAVTTGGAAAATTAATSAGGGLLAGAGAAVSAAAPVILAAGAAAAIIDALDKGGTPTSKAGFLQHMVPGAPAGTTFDIPAFASGFDPVGFAEIASFDQARDVAGSFAALDEQLTNRARELGLNVSLSSNDFGGYGPEGTGSGVFWGTAFEDGKQGTALQDQLDRYAQQWIVAVGGKNQVPQSVIDEYVGKGSYQNILEHASLPSHESGLAEVPYDGYVAELHAGERVLTAQQADAADTMSADFAALRGSIEEIMIAVARNTAKSYRLYDRWDKNGLPPERTT
jgi:predicted  nucleic acid-binding Zn-ribbon protein